MSHALRRSTSSAGGAKRQARRFELLQVVYARRDVPEEGVRKGQRGTIVHLFKDSPLGDAYLVEFSNEDGETLEEAELTAEQLAVAPPPP